MAQVFLTGGLKTSARRALETALELDPKSEPARALLAKI
jgi:Tfp pilus assembly protein PilF